MTLLSTPLTGVRPHYDVVVIGSGYGGSIAASRLSRARRADGTGLTVCILERGREIPVGEFPDSLLVASGEMQTDHPKGHVGRKDALYDLRVNDDISVFQGCGLGGTSLVNANVSLEPDPRVFDDERWPKEIREDVEKGIADGLRRARDMLAPVPYPDDRPRLDKFAALKESARSMGVEDLVSRPPINVTFEDGLNPAGVRQKACNGCGDCVSGCNVGAKNTLMMNYLPDARRHGAEIFTRVAVRRVERAGERWVVHYRPVGFGRSAFRAGDLFVSADVVVLGAGTLGTAEILLRSRDAGLACSDMLGTRFTGNGDVLGFGFNNDRRVNGIGAGAGASGTDPAKGPGPCITGIIDRRGSDELEAGFVIEEGSIPGVLAPILPAGLSAAAALVGKDTDRGFMDWVREKFRIFVSKVFGARSGAVANTQTYLIMAHDDAGGRLELEDDRVRVRWPGVGANPLFPKLNGALEKATKATGGTYVPSPLYHRAFGYDLVTVHPLGGCPMAADAGAGAVDHKGRLFSGPAGADVHPGLYVSDGAVMPRALGVNPLLTISAIAERNMRLLAEDRGLEIDYAWPEDEADFGPDPKTDRVSFTERMAGHVTTDPIDDFNEAAKRGEETESSCDFVLTILSEDLDEMIRNPAHQAGLFGTATVTALSSAPMTASKGRFNLFVTEGDAKRMRYGFRLDSVEGERYWFEGRKEISDDEGADVWIDTTTLFVTIHDGEDEEAPVRARGILRIDPKDFAAQMTTMDARDAKGKRSLSAQARFGRFFAGELWDTYGPEALRGAKP